MIYPKTENILNSIEPVKPDSVITLGWRKRLSTTTIHIALQLALSSPLRPYLPPPPQITTFLSKSALNIIVPPSGDHPPEITGELSTTHTHTHTHTRSTTRK